MKYLIVILITVVTISAQEKKQVFNPDGRIGTFFVDLGAGTTLNNKIKINDEILETGATQDFSFAMGIPVHKKATISAGFKRAVSSETINNINTSISGNYVYVNLRFYIHPAKVPKK